MIRFIIAVATVFTMSFGTMAAQTAGQPCAVSANLPQGIPTTEEMYAARLACEIVEAQSIVDKANTKYDVFNQPTLRVIDTRNPSGHAYVYDVMQAADALNLDVRIVSLSETPAPACRLRKQLNRSDANNINDAVFALSLAKEPAYVPREKTFRNVDGSRRVELLLDAKDVLTSITMDGPTQHYSRHDQSNDKVTALNDRITEIANRSDGWVCN